MVALPEVNNVVPIVRAPESRVTPSDIAQPYQEMAQNLDKAAGVLNEASVAIAKNAGLKAVTRDADGNVQVEHPPLIGDAAIAFHQAVKVAAVADGEGVLKRDDIALRQQFRDDPDGYVKAADAYRKQKIDQYTQAAGPDVGITLGKIIDGQTTLTYRGLLNEHEKLTMQRADASIASGITSATDDLTAMARGGVTSGPAFEAARDKIATLTQQRVNNPRLAYPPEQAQYDLQHLEAQVKANGFLFHIDQVYKDQDPEKGGARGALEQAKSILTDPSIKLSEAQREQFYHRAVGEVRANEAIRKQDLSEARAAFNELSLVSASGGRIMPDQVEQVASGFRSAGDPGGAARVYASFIRKPLNDNFGQQPLATQTQQLTALQGANAAGAAHSFFVGKGYTPEQAAGIVGNLVHESGMNPGAVGDAGTSGGLAQFHNERLTALKSFAAERGKPASDFQTQLEFIDRELHTSEAGTLTKLQGARTPEEAAAAFIHYERPQGYTPENPAGGLGYQSRISLARQVFDRKSDGSMGPAGTAWLAANRKTAVDDTATAQWKTVMSDYSKEQTRPSLKQVNDIVTAARATGNAALLDTIAADAQRMDLSGEFSHLSLPEQHTQLAQMKAAGERGELPPALSATMKDLQARNTAITKGLEDNPISTAVTNFPDKLKPPPALDFANDQNLAAGLRARAGISQFASENWQVAPVSALDAADVAQVQAQLSSPDPAVKARVFNAISVLPEQVRNATLAKIGSNRPDLMVSVAAGSLMKGAPDVGAGIIRGQAAIAMDKGYIPAKGAESVAFDQKFDEHIPASIFSLAARTDASGPYAVAQGMVKARYADLSAQSSDTAGKLNPDRLTQAVNDVTGGVLDHNGGKLIAPVRGMPQAIFDRTMAGVTDADLGNAPSGNLLDQARAQYPILNKHDYGYVENFQKNAGFLEHWEPGEAGAAPANAQSLDRLRPGGLPLNKPGLEIRDPKTRPIDILGDIASHHLIKEDPVVKSAYEKLQSSMTPAQKDILKDQYEHAKKNEGEDRSFEEWKTASGMPGFFRGYTFQQWPKEFNDKVYTSEQRADLDKLMGYLSRGGKSPDSAASVTSLNGEKIDANYLRNHATLESVGDGRYFVKLGKDPLRPVYAYQGANTESPQKFMLDLRNRPQAQVTPALAMAQP